MVEPVVGFSFVGVRMNYMPHGGHQYNGQRVKRLSTQEHRKEKRI